MRLAELRVERMDSIVHASLRGEVDMSNTDEIRLELTGATTNDALALVLDLTDVVYLDSAGIHMIHRLREDLRARGQRLALVIPADSLINDTLRLAGLDWEKERVESVEEARRLLGSNGMSHCH